MSKIPPEQYASKHGHRPAVLWLTGLSAAGKSTLAENVQAKLLDDGIFAVVLDGDHMRQGLCQDLGFSPQDRSENIRRVRHVAKLFYDHGAIVITAFISPYADDRQLARTLFPAGDFFEIHVDCPLDVCIQRDPKDLYQKAIIGTIPDFTGISAPYEAPTAPDLQLDTSVMPITDCIDQIVQLLSSHS